MLKKISLLLLLLLIGVSIFFWQQYQQALTTQVITEKAILIEIQKGDSFNRITQNLIEQGVQIQPLWFKFIAHQQKLSHRLKAGEYKLAVGLTIPELLKVLVSGKSQQYSITFPEGWNFKQLRAEIEKFPQLKQTLKSATDEQVMHSLGLESQHPEGWFFPDTYYFNRNSSDVALLKRAQQKMQTMLVEEWQQRADNLPLKTPYEALILASIIEKETGLASERQQISGVFIRRLNKGMLLQTDPTVIYGMGDSYQGNIRRKDLRTPTAYNTYVIKGLPPTPIAMPGKAAIYAALHPAEGKSYYFVAKGKGDGSHFFSSTLREHNRAVDIYQRNIKRR